MSADHGKQRLAPPPLPAWTREINHKRRTAMREAWLRKQNADTTK